MHTLSGFGPAPDWLGWWGGSLGQDFMFINRSMWLICKLTLRQRGTSVKALAQNVKRNGILSYRRCIYPHTMIMFATKSLNKIASCLEEASTYIMNISF